MLIPVTMESVIQVRPKIRTRAFLEQEQLLKMCMSIQNIVVQNNDAEMEQERKRQKTETGYIAVY